MFFFWFLYVSHFLSVFSSSGGSSDTWFRHPLQALYHVDSSSASWVILHLGSSFSMFAFWKHWLESSKLGQIHASKQPASGAPGDTPSPKDVVVFNFSIRFTHLEIHFSHLVNSPEIWGRDLPDALQRWADENLDVRRGRWPGSEQGSKDSGTRETIRNRQNGKTMKNRRSKHSKQSENQLTYAKLAKLYELMWIAQLECEPSQLSSAVHILRHKISPWSIPIWTISTLESQVPCRTFKYVEVSFIFILGWGLDRTEK